MMRAATRTCPTAARWSASIVGLIAVLMLCTGLAAAAPGDIIFERAGPQSADPQYPPAVFPHWVHRIRNRCDACHTSIFEMKAGSLPITMDMIMRGEACGKCHNGIAAFDVDFQSCSRCHKPKDE